jgi:hypothetical protein
MCAQQSGRLRIAYCEEAGYLKLRLGTLHSHSVVQSFKENAIQPQNSKVLLHSICSIHAHTVAALLLA